MAGEKVSFVAQEKRRYLHREIFFHLMIGKKEFLIPFKPARYQAILLYIFND